MRFQHQGNTYEVTWNHARPYQPGNDQPDYKRWTECIITHVDPPPAGFASVATTVGYAKAICGDKDQFSRSKGRMVSFTRALHFMIKRGEGRRGVWNQVAPFMGNPIDSKFLESVTDGYRNELGPRGLVREIHVKAVPGCSLCNSSEGGCVACNPGAHRLTPDAHEHKQFLTEHPDRAMVATHYVTREGSKLQKLDHPYTWVPAIDIHADCISHGWFAIFFPDGWVFDTILHSGWRRLFPDQAKWLRSQS